MSTAQLPIDRERLSRELDQPSEEYKEQIANTVIRKLAAGPPERKPEAPDLLKMKGVLREDGDESIRPGTKALEESRECDERMEREMLDRLRSDE